MEKEKGEKGGIRGQQDTEGRGGWHRVTRKGARATRFLTKEILDQAKRTKHRIFLAEEENEESTRENEAGKEGDDTEGGASDTTSGKAIGGEKRREGAQGDMRTVEGDADWEGYGTEPEKVRGPPRIWPICAILPKQEVLNKLGSKAPPKGSMELENVENKVQEEPEMQSEPGEKAMVTGKSLDRRREDEEEWK